MCHRAIGDDDVRKIVKVGDVFAERDYVLRPLFTGRLQDAIALPSDPGMLKQSVREMRLTLTSNYRRL